MTTPEAWCGMDLWQHADRLVRGGVIAVDRPRGSAHPKVREFAYPLDYGYIEGTSGGDGEAVDVWVGDDAREVVTAVAMTIDPFKNNAELKLLWRCSPEQITLVEEFYAPQPQAAVVVRRPV